MWIIGIIILVLMDQGTKILVENTMVIGEQITLIPGVFNIRYIINDGAAFGMLSGGRIFFIVIGIAMVVFMVFLLLNDRKQGRNILPEILIIGGGIGNLIDRIFLSGVRDFLDVPFFAVMNLADWFVSAGIILLLAKYIYYWRKEQKEKLENQDKEVMNGK